MVYTLLGRFLTDLTAIKQDSFVTIIDEADDDVFVNVVLNIEQA